MQLFFGALACSLLLFACSSKEQTSPTRVVPQPVASPVQTPEAAAGKTTQADGGTGDAPAAATTSVGYTEIPPLPSASQQKALKAALSLHRKKDYTGSRDALRALFDQAPNFQGAGYNLACALSRLGETKESASHMAKLLDLDLPHYRSRLRSDPDLETLRSSPEAAALEKQIADLETSWRQAVAGGLPTIMWRGTMLDKSARRLVRAGVWLDNESRFVPLGAQVRNAMGALADLPNERVLSVVQQPSRDEEEEFEFSATVHPFYGESDPVFQMKPEIGHEMELFPAKDGLMARWHLNFGQAQFENARWQSRTSPIEQGKVETGHGTNTGAPPPRSYLYVAWNTAILQDGNHKDNVWSGPHLDGFSIKGNTIKRPKADSISLTRGHGQKGLHSLIVNEDGSILWALSSGSCKHIVDRIVLATGEVTPVHAGPGLATARFHKGVLYMQLGSELRRFGDATTAWEKATPLTNGVGFVLPGCQ